MKKQASLLKSNSQGSLTATEIVLPGIVEPNGLLVQARTLNNPKSDEVILKMQATGVSFAEKAMRKDQYPGMPKFPFVPGYDLAGTVVAVGNNADNTLIGKQFACLTLTGGWATYATVKTIDLLPIPEGINPVDAETLIVNGVTAWQMLHRDAKIKKAILFWCMVQMVVWVLS